MTSMHSTKYKETPELLVPTQQLGFAINLLGDPRRFAVGQSVTIAAPSLRRIDVEVKPGMPPAEIETVAVHFTVEQDNDAELGRIRRWCFQGRLHVARSEANFAGGTPEGVRHYLAEEIGGGVSVSVERLEGEEAVALVWTPPFPVAGRSATRTWRG